jgi:selenocysteine lyase/cysteine desulfurase
MLAFTGHKALLGPTGTGGLYIAPGVTLHTLKEGGTGGMSASPFMPEEAPDRYEAGTMNISGLAGLCASVEFLLETGVENIRRHEVRLMQFLMDELEKIPEVVCYGPKDAEARLGLISFNLAGHDPQKVAKALDDEYGIMVRAGLHCAPQAHRLIGAEQGTLRASVSWINKPEEIQVLAYALKETVHELQGMASCS